MNIISKFKQNCKEYRRENLIKFLTIAGYERETIENFSEKELLDTCKAIGI